MKKAFLIATLICFAAIQADETTRRQDLNAILQKNWLSPQVEPFLNLTAQKVISEHAKQIDSDEIISQFRAIFTDAASWVKFYEAYSAFSDEEIHHLRNFYESSLYGKLVDHSNAIFQQQVPLLEEIFKSIVDRYGVLKPTEELPFEFLEITQANFQKEILESKKPVIIDVYSNSCPPCRLMEPILKELCREFKKEIVFARINCETELELARKYGVTQLPTFLFIAPGHETASYQLTGFTPKKQFQEKIAELLKK